MLNPWSIKLLANSIRARASLYWDQPQAIWEGVYGLIAEGGGPASKRTRRKVAAQG